jgi:hypothetical protein
MRTTAPANIKASSTDEGSHGTILLVKVRNFESSILAFPVVAPNAPIRGTECKLRWNPLMSQIDVAKHLQKC